MIEPTTSITVANRRIGPGEPPFVIAEVSANHNHSLERAKAIIDAAAAAGVDAIKLQTYTADSLTIDVAGNEFEVQEADSLWAHKNLYQLYQEAAMPYEWHAPLFAHARQLGLLAFSTPFDEAGVALLEELDVPLYKVASCESVDLGLIAAIARTGKPMIISTGMASLEEMAEAVSCARDHGCRDLILLKCVVSYPADPKDYNLRTIPDMADRFGVQVGLSDHTLGVGTAVASVCLGATVIEKHMTLSRSDGGVDDAFSTEPAEMAQLVEACRVAQAALGQVDYGLGEAETANRKYRRSLYFVRDVAAGEVLTADDVRSIRPGMGLKPKHLAAVLGKPVKQAVAKGTPVAWDLLNT
ncbi:MAG: pseudaminic acid synthase [Cyanobacteria bacterium HKST-UBA03]|nr:pseudaminic acid synthase [Cyanobacteria bacterium HKST-UBA03]